MAIRSFADTSAVSIAYGFSDAADSSEWVSADMFYVPFTTEGFSMEKEAKVSQAITANRRVTGSKNTKGSASGAVTTEFGANQFCLDLLSAMLMNDWTESTDGLYSTITDGDIKKYMVVEKVVRPDVGATKKQSLERYYGTLVNDGTLEFGDGELVTLALNTISAFAENEEDIQGEDGLGGSIATDKVKPDPYEIADASNNLKNIKIKTKDDDELEMVFSSASLQVENNVREQPGLGHVFAAGIGMGKVNVTMSGDIYYYDQTILEMHMTNQTVSAEMDIATDEGTFKITLPKLSVQSPTANAGGENQDYTSSITLTAEQGYVDSVPCVIHIKYTPTAISGP